LGRGGALPGATLPAGAGLHDSQSPDAMRTQKIFTRADAQGVMGVYLDEVELGDPADDEVIVRVEAAPLNPSDIANMFGPSDLEKMEPKAGLGLRALTAPLDAAGLALLGPRLGKSLPTGNEGAGVVVAAGAGAEHLVGRRVALIGREMYAEFVRTPASACFLLPAELGPAQGAGSLINPLTVMGMIDTMDAHGHRALVHTAAASSLGQMLIRHCREMGIPLVNIVRRPEQVQLLKSQGAAYVCDTSSPTFEEELKDALAETGATVAFDALGGGATLGRVLSCMEAVALARTTHPARYGSMTWKSVYVYGFLETSPITFSRGFDFSWNVAGWLLTPFLDSVSPARKAELWNHIAPRLTTTFASHYSQQISLSQVLDPAIAAEYTRRGTNQKYLVAPAAASGGLRPHPAT
jgi:NADPH:quinone reductase